LKRKTFTKEQIIETLETHKTYQEAANYLGVCYRTLRYQANKFNIHWKNYTSKGCRVKYDLVDIFNGKHPQYRSSKLKPRLIKNGYKKDVCEICGIGPEWNGKKLILELDHVNGNSSDHRLENLRILCPNCHTQTSTFKGRK